MLTRRSLRIWAWLHKWTSLVSTVFLLLLCITGLPLIFHHEIDDLSGEGVPPKMAADAPRASLDAIVAAAGARRPDWKVQFVFQEPDEPDRVIVSLIAALDAVPDSARNVVVDARTARVLAEPDDSSGFMAVMLKLHVEIFAGLPGKLFLGLMALLFLVALVSGVVLYAPFMRKLAYGTVRRERATRIRWLDWHNLVGVTTIAWALVVGATGMINTWADLVIKFWQFDQLGAMTAPYKGQPAPARLGSVQRAVEVASGLEPSMRFAFVAYPGTLFTSPHHYAVFLRGTTPVTARLLKPALIDAQTTTLTDSRALPWYVTALLISQPLHFGDYGGLPLKIVWAMLDLATIVVLGSGLYLWLARRRRSIDDVLDESDVAGEARDRNRGLPSLASKARA